MYDLCAEDLHQVLQMVARTESSESLVAVRIQGQTSDQEARQARRSPLREAIEEHEL